MECRGAPPKAGSVGRRDPEHERKGRTWRRSIKSAEQLTSSHNPARDLLYEYADLQRELDLQINEVEELEGMEPDRLRDELIARIQKRIECGIERERLLREKVDAMLAGIKMPKHREALTRRYIDGEDWPEILEALGIKEKRKAPALHKCALRAANRSLERLGGSCRE